MANTLKDVMAYLLKAHPPKWSNGLTNTRLNNLVYLADWYYARKHGQLITTDIRWKASDFGGYGVYVDKIAKTAKEHEGSTFIIKRDGKKQRFSLKSGIPVPELADTVKEALDYVVEKTKNRHGNMNDPHGGENPDFFKLVHETDPMQGAKPGQYLNHVGKTKK